MDDAFRKMRRPSGHLLTEGKWSGAGIERSTSLQEPALTMRLAACMPDTVLFGDDLSFALGLSRKTGILFRQTGRGIGQRRRSRIRTR